MATKTNGFIYLASPYSHPDKAVREERVAAVQKVAAQLMDDGHNVFCPIAHTYPLEDLVQSCEHGFWMKQDIAILQHAEELVVLCIDGWADSKGVGEEIAYAKAHGIKVTYNTRYAARWLQNNAVAVSTGQTRSAQPGVKLDDGKSKVVRGCLHYFPHALAEVAKVSEKGSEKYSWDGWRTVPEGVTRYTDALGRHLLSEAGGVYDEETGLRHAAQVAWNALARLELILTQAGEETGAKNV